MQDDNVKKLLNLCKFGNAKRLSKMQTYKHTNFDYIREISSEIIKFTNIERNVKEFGSYCINLNEKTSIDDLMKEWMIDIIHDWRKLTLKFWGIVSKLKPYHYNIIFETFLHEYNKLISYFSKPKPRTKWRRIIREINQRGLEVVYHAHQVSYNCFYNYKHFIDLKCMDFQTQSKNRTTRHYFLQPQRNNLTSNPWQPWISNVYEEAYRANDKFKIFQKCKSWTSNCCKHL